MYYNVEKNDYFLIKFIGWIIGLFIFWLIIASCSQLYERERRDMVYISDGYCYKEDTQIIYEEYFTGRFGTDAIYTPYYDTNGYLCKYNLQTGEWIPITNSTIEQK